MSIGQFLLGIISLPLVIAPLLEMTDVFVIRFENQKIKVIDMWAGLFNSCM